MMTSSNGNIFRVTGPLCGEFTGPGEFPTQRPVTRSFDVFFDLHLNKRLSKQPWGWWFETLSWSLWRQCNGSCTCRRSDLEHYCAADGKLTPHGTMILAGISLSTELYIYSCMCPWLLWVLFTSRWPDQAMVEVIVFTKSRSLSSVNFQSQRFETFAA